MLRIYRLSILTAALGALSAAGAAADSWLPPTEQDYYSPTGEYYVHVVPGDGTRHARGTLFRAGDPDHADELWSRELLNPTAPHQVLVADSGEYVVTFDEWGRVGYGPNVVVIYGPGGELVRNFALEGLLTEKEIAAVPQTVSSRWWSDEHYLDEAAGVVVLKVVAAPPEPDREVAFREIRIRLSDGEVLP
jgi:hypothetical protein